MTNLIKVLLGLFCLSLLFINELQANDKNNTSNTITLKTQFNQYKDEFNYGLVYNGVNLGCRYVYEAENDNNLFAYSPEFGFGANFNKGVGLAWRVKPVDLFYGWEVTEINNVPFYLGGYIATNYSLQLYPELQSGHSLWMTTIEVGPEVSFQFPILEEKIKVNFAVSLAGLTSRPKFETESHFYSLALMDFISNAHDNLEFAFSNVFSHTQLELSLVRSPQERFYFSYEFEMLSYFKQPTFDLINHSLNLNWYIGEL